jgi:hypothetical protein
LHKFTPIWHHAFALCSQLIAFSPRFGCALRFTPYAQLLWNPLQEVKGPLPTVDLNALVEFYIHFWSRTHMQRWKFNLEAQTCSCFS